MFMWITARTIHAGKEEEFKLAWQAFMEDGKPPGLLQVSYAVQVDDPRRVLGISVWESREACDAYRSSQGESERWSKLQKLVQSVDFSNYFDAEEVDLP